MGVAMSREKIGQIIKERRKARGWTLTDVALRSGVSITHIGRIEEGKRFPSARTLRKLAKPLGFTEIELFKLAGFLSEDEGEIQIFKLAEYL